VYDSRRVSYLRTISIAIGICFLVLILRSVLFVLSVAEKSGFALGAVSGGITEALLISVLAGWLGGTVWYLIRRRYPRKNSAA
jgi:hypothetical protein